MNLTTALMIYLLVWVISLLVFLSIGIHGISAIILALIIGFIVINVIFPPSKISVFQESNSEAMIYYLVEIVTPLIIFIYTIIVAWHDRNFVVKRIVVEE